MTVKELLCPDGEHTLKRELWDGIEVVPLEGKGGLVELVDSLLNKLDEIEYRDLKSVVAEEYLMLTEIKSQLQSPEPVEGEGKKDG